MAFEKHELSELVAKGNKMRLKDNHPLIQALDKLSAYADELGIQIDYSWNKSILIYQGREYELLDIDNNRPMSVFPPTLEYNLVLTKGD